MASYLIVGQTHLISDESVERLAAENTVVLAGSEAKYGGKTRSVHTYASTPADDDFKQLFDAYTFDAVWYISGYADCRPGAFGEEKLLEKALETAAVSRIEKFVLLSSVYSLNYFADFNASGEAETGYNDLSSFGASQLEELAAFYAKKSGMKVVTIRVPYIADRLNDQNFLGRVFCDAHEGKKVIFPHSAEDRIDFLSVSDLLALLVQVTEENEDVTGSYVAVSGYRHTYSDLEERLREAVPEIDVEYERTPCDIVWPDYPNELRKRYGFIPMDDVLDSVGEYYAAFVDEVYSEKEGLLKRLFKKFSSGIFKYIELILLLLVTEIIAQFTSNSVYFKFVDVRLAYIVIMGTVHGMRTGILAALLESVVLIFEYIGLGMSGTLLFYNIENWIPFVVYLMAGSIPGYVRDKSAEETQFVKSEYDLLRNKYLFLNNAYYGAIQNKGEFKRQILGFKDSFGKIFDAVQKLDSELPQSVFLEGLKVMEDILENRSVAIYTVDSRQRFGRLVACSGNLLSRLSVSIPLEEYSEMYGEVKAGRVYKNTALRQDMPMYACGVFQNGSVVLLVVLWDASSEQYGNHYTNIFQIICGLVQTSFLRALEYEKLRHDSSVIPGTRVVLPERFEQIISVNEELKQAGAAEYMLLRFEERDPEKLSEALSGMVRASDTIGQGSDGRLYLLLTQVTGQNFSIVGQRLAQRSLAYDVVDAVGAVEADKTAEGVV